MNTENRVLAMLNKIGNVRTAKKENLGAIEDAINDVKSNIAMLETRLYDITNELNNELDNSESIINNEIDNVKQYSTSYDNDAYDVQQQYTELYSELKNAGIDYDESDMDKAMSDFSTAFNRLQTIFASKI